MPCAHTRVYITLDLVTQCNKRQTSDAIKREKERRRERERKVNKRIRNYTFDFWFSCIFVGNLTVNWSPDLGDLTRPTSSWGSRHGSLIVGFGLINVDTNQSEQRLGWPESNTYQVENWSVKLNQSWSWNWNWSWHWSLASATASKSDKLIGQQIANKQLHLLDFTYLQVEGVC